MVVTMEQKLTSNSTVQILCLFLVDDIPQISLQLVPGEN